MNYTPKHAGVLRSGEPKHAGDVDWSHREGPRIVGNHELSKTGDLLHGLEAVGRAGLTLTARPLTAEVLW